MNDFLWQTIGAWGWWYWSFAVLLSATNLLWLALLRPPATALGRAARVLAWIAHIVMLFTIQFNALGMVALPLMIASNNLLYLQVCLACRDRADSPNRAYGARGALQKLIAPE